MGPISISPRCANIHCFSQVDREAGRTTQARQAAAGAGPMVAVAAVAAVESQVEQVGVAATGSL